MSKEIETKECEVCESSFKLVYELDKTSGYSKFCPFCASELNTEETEEYSDED